MLIESLCESLFWSRQLYINDLDHDVAEQRKLDELRL
jgi:hypothetical protein